MDETIIIEYRTNYTNFMKLFPRVYDVHLNNEIISVKVTRDNLYNFITFLRYDFLHQLKILLEITAFDTPGKILRFAVVYSLISIELNARYQVYTQTDPYLGLETVLPLYSASNWSEREIWDIYGLIIWNHPDLRRILTDYGFDGFPLRKDFPLSGYVEKVYSHTTKTVEDRRVQLSQELRAYKYEDAWEEEEGDKYDNR